MRLSWNEIRPRAAEFARDWADAGNEKGETQSFYNALFRIFGVERRSVARYEEHVKRLDDSQGCSGRACCSSSRRAPAVISPRRAVRRFPTSTP